MAHNGDFELPITELENRIEQLRKFASERHMDLSVEIENLEHKLSKLKKEIYSNLSPWQKVQIARHPQRPYTLDYVQLAMEDFIPIHGDRCFGDDPAIIAGLAKISGIKIAVLGHQKGRDVKENILRNFGCAHPEGYRKAKRLMYLAQRFGLPLVCLIDTPGAYPGIGAEERGQALAIAENIRDMFALKIPIIVVIIGEGGSGGALGIGVGNRVLIMEYAYYSVISPEGCASILWRDAAKAPLAAEALKLTAPDLLKMKIVDDIIPEPEGGAHKDHSLAAQNFQKAVLKHLKQLLEIPASELVSQRYQKFRSIGSFSE